MNIVFMGTPDFAVGTLNALIESEHNVIGVVTQPDKPKGRGGKMMFTPVKEAAVKAGLQVYQPEKVRDRKFIEILEKLSPDVISAKEKEATSKTAFIRKGSFYGNTT